MTMIIHPPAIWGERHHFAKLTDERVRQIRARYAAGERILHLAHFYGVTPMTISKVVHGRAWKHVV